MVWAVVDILVQTVPYDDQHDGGGDGGETDYEETEVRRR